MATYPEIHIRDLQAAYNRWPGRPAEKTALAAIVLRVRIERAAARLPRTVIAAQPDISMVERRLYLSIGEAGLSHEGQVRRMQVIAGALEAYGAICEVLHGRNPDPLPPLEDLESWTRAVDALEKDLYPGDDFGAAAGHALLNAQTAPRPTLTAGRSRSNPITKSPGSTA
ncbi:hypothetical protein Ait01nite_091860 [Actinoplanes italicus]|uniref:Uncharacterized protein n=1 Tax=Actinoplanes italicus TaxID=113567 RepID=A0A2T0JSH7_9ACTN|nr:hypothetical protein [Actinoplanes italicus]PRX10584.1 hypothetical protein CLV67_13364 [Actinoplanes italicus]GIE36141.1 hypothetical protein Ait01nite_091860 [Actinoplanes italicus]